MTKFPKEQCGICAECVPQVNGGSGFTNCADAHAAETAGDKLQLMKNMRTKPLEWVAEAYFVHLLVRHRRPVYRHINGDIALNVPSIGAFIDGYLAEKRNPEQRQKLYLSLLNFRAMEAEDDKAWLVNWGGVSLLTPRGLRLIDAMFNRLGFMAEEVDLTNCDMLGKRDAH
ncbi:hypothetical protein ACV8TN_05410 [Citrobacter freundii]|uniref:hypothetical protein n=1 Tax=Enterobacter roggenkampii TaxID=1812935 RepID=UPI0021FCD3E2|nr:hypothetical protein [Enterobacter roggenkampii]BDS20976.1 hypothetical protein KAM546c_22370 [Enterobacter roggenkampii]